MARGHCLIVLLTCIGCWFYVSALPSFAIRSPNGISLEMRAQRIQTFPISPSLPCVILGVKKSVPEVNHPPSQKEKSQKIWLAFGLFGLLSFTSFVFVCMRKNETKNRNYQWQLINDVTKLNLENKILKTRLKNKQKEILKMSHLIERKNEAFMILINETKRMKKQFQRNARTDQIIETSQKAFKNNSSDAKAFDAIYNEINSGFYKDLIERKCTSLTHKDLRFCAYITMGLTTKEIAPLLGISKKGCEIKRYRLRKKLKLKKEESFYEFLTNNSPYKTPS